ncbi:GLPGLI family protein [Winogradskyella immobilis]|uniref:GLPGLI family protein n=1 Tax=Winogradskyella immobilis TaxID=2816852 RepID=A0ABS8ER12_9FLAO|nr:GLPGLI family protein [Winogradskyella immobilis]MCC1485663.1 GLPGLI family protein [Winogradskyella immobilis]MCG0017756.1 GLPGLI family protein [Winogradskyella immobilis]
MIKQYTLYFLIFLNFSSFSQQNNEINFYKIEYLETVIHPFLDEQQQNSNYTLNLFVNLNRSVFNLKTEIDTSPQVIENKTKKGKASISYTPSGENWGVTYKDYQTKKMFFKYSNRHTVVDSLSAIFNWEIKDETKELLGYNCQKATMNFRGRDYTAWFTSDLPVGGPWKYDGLPGMILEIKSADGFIKFKALSIKNNTLKNNILENPFNKTNKYTSWQDYKDFYKKRAIRGFSYRPAESSRGVEYSRGGIEIYIDYDDEEYNKILERYRKNNN